MGKTQVNEKDRPDLERLEQIVKDAGHAGIGTAELSRNRAPTQRGSGACSTTTSPESRRGRTPSRRAMNPPLEHPAI